MAGVNIYTELLRAQLENLASDPAAGLKGRVYYNTATGVTRLDNGATWNNIAHGIVNADVDAAAALAYSKLSLAASIKASDMNSQASAGGSVLTADGAGAASYQAISVTPTAVNAKSADYTLQTSDDVVTFTGTHNATLFTAVGNSGKNVTVANIGSGDIIVLTTSAQTYGGRPSGDMILKPGDHAKFCSDGANWLIVDSTETKVVSQLSAAAGIGAIGNGNYGQITSNSITLGIGKWRVYGKFIVFNGGGTNNFLKANSGFYSANGANNGSQPAALSGASGLTTFDVEAAAGAGLGNGATASTAIAETGTLSFRLYNSASQTVYLVPQVNVGTAGSSDVTCLLWAERVA